jgi:class 3 adenylate cyclase
LAILSVASPQAEYTWDVGATLVHLTSEQPQVLVVDDDVRVGAAIGRHLEGEPYGLTVLADPLLAVEELSRQEFALILSDNMMPEMTGLELLSIAMGIAPDTRRLLITGYTDLDHAIRAFNSGIIHRYIAKPWERAKLQATVREQLDVYLKRVQERAALRTMEQALSRRTSLLKEAMGMIQRAEQELEGGLMDTQRVDRKLTVILCGDVVGFSRLMGSDHERTLSMLEDCRALLGILAQKFSGRIVNAVGDSVLAEFDSVVDAVQFAVEAQKELGVRNGELAPEQRMEFRFGISVGDVLIKEGNLYGNGVNVAARLQALAEPGGICVSETAYEQVRHRIPITCRDLGERSLKNIMEPVRVYAVDATR